MVLLSTEKGLKAEEIAEIVRESTITVLRWLKRYSGLGAVNYHTGETVVLIRNHKRRQEAAELMMTKVPPTAGVSRLGWDEATPV